MPSPDWPRERAPHWLESAGSKSWSTQRTKRVRSTQSSRSPGDERQQEVVSHVCRRCVSSPTPAPSARIRPRHRCLYRLRGRSEEHTSELQYLTRISYAGFCLNTKTNPL